MPQRPRCLVHRPQRRIADTAPGHVDDALERQVVRRLHRRAHIGDGVADFGAFIESQPADDAIRHADVDQPLLEGAGLEAGAHQHRHLRQAVAVAAQLLDLAGDHAGFLVGVPQFDDADLLAALRIRPPGPQGLAQPPLIMRDQPGGGGEDRRGRAVVGFQPDDAGALEVLLEAQDVFHLGAAPGIDRLVVVADAADVAVALGEQPQPEVLDQIGVLVLVHQDVAEAAVVIGQHIRLRAQDFRHVQQQVAEIRRVQGAQPLLVRRIQRLRPAVGEVGVLVRRDSRRGQAAVLPALDHPHQPGRSPALGVDALGLHHLLQQAKLVVGVQDGEVGRQPDMLGVAAQHPRAQGVEGAKPQALGGLAEDGADPFPHFAGGLVGESDGEHLVGEGALRQQDMGEAGGQHAGLPRAGAGQHQQRAIDGFDGGALFGVEAGQVVGGEGRWCRHAAGYRAVRGGVETEGWPDGRCGAVKNAGQVAGFRA